MRKLFSVLFAILMFWWISGMSVVAQGRDLSLYDKNGFRIAPSETSDTQELIQNTNTITPPTKSTQANFDRNAIKQGTPASCFDYYTFGSIDVNLTPGYNSYLPGDPMMITGTIKNNNRYPVVGLDIRARLVKNIPAPDEMRAEIMVLDEFDVADNITLDANGEFQVSYTHVLPLNAPSGQYQIYLFAVEQDRFNLSGLSFTNDIVASRFSFDVEGSKPDHIYLDQTKITVGNEPHNVMAFMTQHKSDTKIPISLPLVNPGTTARQMTVTYNLYSWDAANPANKIATKTEQVTVPAKSSYPLIYTLGKAELPVYYLSITAEPTTQTSDTSVLKEKTISNIRFVVQGASKPRLNFVGVDSFPLKKWAEATLITCFHNTNSGIDKKTTTIETVVFDDKNQELSRIEYEGAATPGIEGIKNTFTPKKDIWEFTIVSKMWNAQWDIIDTVEKKYDCKDIDPNRCPPPETVGAVDAVGPFGGRSIGFLLILMLCVSILIWVRKKNNPKK